MAYQVSTGRFVGRTQELARLSQLLADAADGTPLVAVIGGEAGMAEPARRPARPREPDGLPVDSVPHPAAG
jgi:hypothetical protein